MAVWIRHADHMAPSIRKTLALTSATRGGRSVGIVRSRTQAMEFFNNNIIVIAIIIKIKLDFYLKLCEMKN
jgi:hypothetical protein